MNQKRIPLVGKQYTIPFILITSLFFLWGFAHAILDVLNKHFQELLSISKAHSAFIQVTMYMGYFVMAIPAGLFISHFGYRRGVVFGLLLYGLGSMLFIPGQYYLSFNLFLFALFVIGCGLTFLETAANPYATELGAKDTAASRLNFAQSFNGLGCICAPVLTGLLLFSEDGQSGTGNVALPYVCMGVVVLLVALVFSRIRLPEIEHREEVDDKGNRIGLWSHKLFVFGLIALFSYEVGEISINSFFINYVVEQGWMNARDASWVLSFGGLGLFMMGRFTGSWIMGRVRAERMLLVCATGTVVTTSLVLLDVGMVSLVALLCGYAFEAIMFPTIFALSLRGLGRHTKRASSFLMMSPVGGVVGPLLMGVVADHFTMVMAFIVPLAAYCVVWGYARKMVREAC
ncbi:sugar MFS transporter [Bacteroides fluxus]|mgnify:CR=1 FL=1|jgi:FHS family L-fucose permease-like MFS transporter|uniref:Putative L-fucose:H+ symporter permease n=2 Tax=Bacteroides fluxus TaxID=626930 RepID=F3PP10_9BACE|nr:sugar MFS transporter [Bacteroides fluxus]EGF59520.1 putative L-fucose:H+ symporter permease [Bacteroides fluxus YIT 12057]